MTLRRFSFAAGLGAALVAAGCHQEELMTPTPPAYTGGAMFERYVSLGNSITAGVQSGGINDSTQTLAYPVLVAAAMGGQPFYYPGLAKPGCPPPFTNVFTKLRVSGDTVSTTCRFRSPGTPPYVSNVAVPSAEVLDVMKNGPGAGTNSNALTQLMLGGRTQLQAMVAAHPTFVSLWIGNNDVLGAAEAGDTTLATDSVTFKTRYRTALDSVELTGAKAILIGVGLGHLATTVIPYFSRGSTYYLLYQSGAFAPAPFTVTANCASPRGDSVLVPFPFGLALINTAKNPPFTPTTLDCTEAPVVVPTEFVFFVKMQAAYNAVIQSEATTRGWAYVDVNTSYDSLLAAGSQFAPFPNTSAVCSGSPFGLAFSCDGIHPAAAAQRMIARKIVQAINLKYGSAIPAVP